MLKANVKTMRTLLSLVKRARKQYGTYALASIASGLGERTLRAYANGETHPTQAFAGGAIQNLKNALARG